VASPDWSSGRWDEAVFAPLLLREAEPLAAAAIDRRAEGEIRITVSDVALHLDADTPATRIRPAAGRCRENSGYISPTFAATRSYVEHDPISDWVAPPAR
jgi:hypothetical protein